MNDSDDMWCHQHSNQKIHWITDVVVLLGSASVKNVTSDHFETFCAFCWCVLQKKWSMVCLLHYRNISQHDTWRNYRSDCMIQCRYSSFCLSSLSIIVTNFGTPSLLFWFEQELMVNINSILIMQESIKSFILMSFGCFCWNVLKCCVSCWGHWWFYMVTMCYVQL